MPLQGLFVPISSKRFFGDIFAKSNRQDSLCYTSCGALTGTRNNLMSPLILTRMPYVL